MVGIKENFESVLAATPLPTCQVEAQPSHARLCTSVRNDTGAIRSLTAIAALAFVSLTTGSAIAGPNDGAWKGELRCGPSQNNPVKAAAFTNPLTMVVTGRSVTVTRDTDLVMETYSGQVSSIGQAALTGTGRYKDTGKTATWNAKIDGRFNGAAFTGSAQILAQTGQTLRECSVEFAKASTATPSTKQKDAVAVAPPNSKPGVTVPPLISPAPMAPVPSAVTTEAMPTTATQMPKVVASEPTVPPTQATTTGSLSVASERTLTGTMKWGATDSCLDVPDGQSSRCYGFPASGAVAETLLKACNQNDTCTVTGLFDDEKAAIAAVSKAIAVPAIVSPVVEEKQVPAAPVASAASAQPSDKQTATGGFAAIGLGAVVVLALVVGAVLIFRRRPSSPKPVPMPAIAPVVEQGLTLDVDLPPPHLSKTEGMGQTGVASSGSVPQAIWNPNATVWWSLLLSPALGSYLQMRNWHALGEPQKAAQAKTWFYISLVMIAALLTLSEVFGHIPAVRSATGSLPLVYFITWYLQDGRFQGKHVKAKFGTSYPKRPWARVLLIAGAAYLSIIAAVVLMEERSTGPSDAPVRVSRESTNGGSAVASSTACAGGDVMAKFPAAWKDAYILADVNTPEEFPKFICGMGDRGAQVHYLSGGLFSSEGFEVVSKARTVQVYLEARRVPGADPNTPLLVPVKAKIDGNKITISRENYRAFQAELIAAALNQ